MSSQPLTPLKTCNKLRRNTGNAFSLVHPGVDYRLSTTAALVCGSVAEKMPSRTKQAVQSGAVDVRGQMLGALESDSDEDQLKMRCQLVTAEDSDSEDQLKMRCQMVTAVDSDSEDQLKMRCQMVTAVDSDSEDQLEMRCQRVTVVDSDSDDDQLMIRSQMVEAVDSDSDEDQLMMRCQMVETVDSHDDQLMMKSQMVRVVDSDSDDDQLKMKSQMVTAVESDEDQLRMRCQMVAAVDSDSDEDQLEVAEQVATSLNCNNAKNQLDATEQMVTTLSSNNTRNQLEVTEQMVTTQNSNNAKNQLEVTEQMVTTLNSNDAKNQLEVKGQMAITQNSDSVKNQLGVTEQMVTTQNSNNAKNQLDATEQMVTTQNSNSVQNQLEVTEQMVSSLNGDNVEDQLQATRQLRQLVTRPVNPVIQQVVRAGCLTRVVKLLQDGDNWQLQGSVLQEVRLLQHEAAWILCNIAASVSSHTQAVVDAGAVPVLIRLISSQWPEVCRTAVWALANIAGDSPAARDLVLSEDVLTPLTRMVDERDNALVRSVSWLLKNLCQGKDPPPELSQVAPCLPLVCRLIFHSDDQVVEDASWAFTHLRHAHAHKVQDAITSTFFSKVVHLSKSVPQRRSIGRVVEALEELCAAAGVSRRTATTPATLHQLKHRRKSRPSSKNRFTKGKLIKSSVKEGVQNTGKKRSRSPSPVGVSTRQIKRLRKLSRDTTTKVPFRLGVMRTRAAVQKLIRKTPNHSESNILHQTREVFKAVEEGDLQRVEDLIHDTGPAVTRVHTGCTLLHAAAANNQPHVVLFLLKLINPNIVNMDGQTPAHLAAMKGHTQVLRILLSDEELNHDKQDNCHRTYKDLLATPLFEAVLNWDESKIQELLKLGADPDYHAGRLVDGVLTRELQVTTARQMALTLQRAPIFPKVPQKQTILKKNNSCYETSSVLPIGDAPRAADDRQKTSHERAKQSIQMAVPDVYKMDTSPRGYVCVLNYSSFKDRPDLTLEGSHSDVNNLANVFGKMGYTGHAYSSLTAAQTKQVLTNIRDMETLDQVGCAIFIVSSHGVGNEKFLTSDTKLLTTEWVCELLKDSECPRLKNKPKLFIFDFCCGYYQDQTPRQVNLAKCTRVEEPLQDMMCLYSSGGGFTSYTFTKDGTPFITALCRTLAQHAHHMEFGDLYRELLKEYTKRSCSTKPQLRDFAFTKKFYFNPGGSPSH